MPSSDLNITINITDFDSRSADQVRQLLREEFAAIEREVLHDIDARKSDKHSGGVDRKIEASPDTIERRAQPTGEIGI